MWWSATLLLTAAVAAGAAPQGRRRDDAWGALDDVLLAEIANHTFPGCTALVATQAGGLLYNTALGTFTYGAEPAPLSPPHTPMTTDTVFDMASLTKVLATTTAVMALYQRGLLPLDAPVTAFLGEGFAANGKGAVTVRNLLLHNAGYPPDPAPGYWMPAFGCPGSNDTNPLETFACADSVYLALLNQGLANPVGAVFVYSDLSMITMMYVIGTLVAQHGLVDPRTLNADCVAACDVSCAQCYYEAFVRKTVVGTANMTHSGFLPAASLWPGIPPAWNDTAAGAPGNVPYRNRVVQGQVSDQNAYALGGIAGHAGFFSNTADTNALMQRLLYGAIVLRIGMASL